MADTAEIWGKHAVKNVGIIGFGKMGILHSGILASHPDTRIVAICEKNRLISKLAKNLLPNSIQFYSDHIKMIKSVDLDAIVITTPIVTHVPLVVDLVDANNDLSLFVEKPLASSGDQARIACDAARKLRGIHMVGFQKRFSPLFRRAKKLISDGNLGELMFFRAYTFSSDVLREGSAWRFKIGGGVLLDLAPHLLDLLLWFFGMPESVIACRSKFYSREVEDYVHSVLSFPSGLTGHFDACWNMRDFRLPEIAIEVYGRRGSLRVTDGILKINCKMEDGTQMGQTYHNQSFDTSVSFLLGEPEYTKEDEAFLSSMHERKLPELNFFESSRVNSIMDRIIESSQEVLT